MSKRKVGRPKRLERILFLGDLHVPYEDKRAVELVLKAARSFKPDRIVIMGDFVDFFSVSSHSKDPNRAMKLDVELAAAKKELQKIKELGATSVTYIGGNHCERLIRYLMDRAPELYNLISIPAVLELDKLGFDYIPYKEHYKLGKLYMTHDVGQAGRYAAHKALDTFQHNTIIGHTHRLGYLVEGNAEGEAHLGAMFGWLGDTKQADYMHQIKAKRDWAHGFGIGYLDPSTGFTYVTPIPLIEYTCVVEGKIFKN
jgi:predicted phosphodiesterase